jgi:hypothetical protein
MLRQAKQEQVWPPRKLKTSVCVGSSFLYFSSVALRCCKRFGKRRAFSEIAGK